LTTSLGLSQGKILETRDAVDGDDRERNGGATHEKNQKKGIRLPQGKAWRDALADVERVVGCHGQSERERSRRGQSESWLGKDVSCWTLSDVHGSFKRTENFSKHGVDRSRQERDPGDEKGGSGREVLQNRTVRVVVKRKGRSLARGLQVRGSPQISNSFFGVLRTLEILLVGKDDQRYPEKTR